MAKKRKQNYRTRINKKRKIMFIRRQQQVQESQELSTINIQSSLNQNDSNNNDNCLSLSEIEIEEYKNYAEQFEIFQKSILFVFCIICKRRWFNLQIVNDVCKNCRKCIEKSTFNRFTKQNYMDPGILPEELKGLSYVEEMLIALVHPVISVYRIKGGQYGYSGHVINFQQNIQQLATSLPNSIKSICSLIVIRRENADGYTDFIVNRKRIEIALKWLIENNEYYKNIQLNNQILNELPENGSIIPYMNSSCIVEESNQKEIENNDIGLDQINQQNLNSSVVYTDLPNMPYTNVKENIIKTLSDLNVINWPSLCNTPIDEFNQNGYISMAFPTMFPYGNCDLSKERTKVTSKEYFNYLMQYDDGRFSRNHRFR